MYSNEAESATDVDAARDALQALIAGGVSRYSDRELVALLGDFEEVGRLADAFRCLLAGEVDARSAEPDSLARRFGQTRASSLVAQHARISQAAAADRVRLGSQIIRRSPFPGDAAPDDMLPPQREHLAEATTSGTVGIDSALTILRCLTQAGRGPASNTQLAACELELTASAALEPTDDVALQCRVWRDWLDPDGLEPRAEDIHARRGIALGRESHGLTPISGRLAPEFAALVRATFAESLSPDARPRFLSEEDCAEAASAAGIVIGALAGDAPGVTRRLDPRTREQQQHDVLHGLLTAGARSTGSEPGEMRPLTTVLATITVDELLHGTGGAAAVGTGRFAEVDETVPARLIAQAVCDAGLRIVTLDGRGNPLDEGRRFRLFTTRQRRVIALRDGGCAVPGCTAPPSWCVVHHILWWKADHGGTDIENGVLLCPKHHHDVHSGHFAIRVLDGRPHLVPAPWVDPDRRPRPMGHPLGRPRGAPPSRRSAREPAAVGLRAWSRRHFRALRYGTS
jgi:hypothetical protein